MKMARADTSRLSRARCGGVVMVIALLAIILIASLLFYVYNVGTSIQGRVVTQHAADATAIGGASQVARSMNTVAMNNVETARIISAVTVLDGIPLAVDMSITDATEEELGDIDALAQAVTDQVRAGVVDNWFDRKLREMIDPNDTESVIAERDYMRELDELFRNQPDLIPELTWYRAPSGQMGRMHQAMRSMDAHSQAVMNILDETTQSAAARSAQANLGNQNAGDGGLLLPAAPNIPWQRGVFADYERPIKYGLLPGSDRRLSVDSTSFGLGQIDDELTNRGPWDAVFGWRYTDRIDADPGSIPTSSSLPPQTSRPTSGRDPEDYRVYGPEFVMVRTVPWRRYSRLRNHLWNIHAIKSNYLWSDDTLRTVLDSDWEIDIEHDNERSTDRNSDHVYGYDRSDIRQTMFVVVEIKSRIADEQGLPQRQGLTWNYIDIPGRRSPRVLYRNGWSDPRNGSPISINQRTVVSQPTWTKVQDHIWRLSTVYETDPDGPDLGGDPSIGLAPKRIGTDGDGNPIYAAQEVHWFYDVMLVGVNVGEDIEVTNPWDGFNRDAEDSPAPIDLVKQFLPPNNFNARLQYLTFLGIARRSNRPSFWPTRFQGDKPYPYNTAIAQAHVFNNHSWDLWTQTWQAQLEPVDRDRFDDWIDLADDAVSIAQTAPAPGLGLDLEQVQEMADHLHSVETLAPVMLNH